MTGIQLRPASEWVEHKSNRAQWETWKTVTEVLGKNFPNQMGEIFDPPVSQDEIDARYTILRQTPVPTDDPILEEVGDDVPKIDMLNRANDTPTWLAISEILDNIIDNYRLTSKKLTQNGIPTKDLEVKLLIYDMEDISTVTLQIHENSGGIPKTALSAFIAPGVSEWGSVEGSVGVWGNGQKIGMAKLGRHNEVSSNNGVEPPFTIRLGSAEDPDEDGGQGSVAKKHPKNYYHPQNKYWKVQPVKTDAASAPEEGKTISVFRKIPEGTYNDLKSDEEWKKIVDQMIEIFANKIMEVKSKVRKNMVEKSIEFESEPQIKIIFKREGHESVDIANPPNLEILGKKRELSGDFANFAGRFCQIPGAKPRHVSVKIPASLLPEEYNVDIYIEAIVGLTTEKPDNIGLTIWGNGKLFCKQKTDFMSVGGGSYVAWNPTQGSGAQNFWKCYVKIWSKNPLLIPWSVGTKDGYRDSSPAEKIFRVIFHAICHPFWVASGELQELGGQLRRVSKLYTGWDSRDLPEPAEKFSMPTNLEEFEEILSSIYSMDADQMRAMLSKEYGTPDYAYYRETEEVDGEPVHSPIEFIDNSELRAKLQSTQSILPSLFTGTTLSEAPNIPKQSTDDLNNPAEDRLHHKYIAFVNSSAAFIKKEEV